MFENKNDLKKYGKVIQEKDKILVYVNQKVVYRFNNKVLLCEIPNKEIKKDIYFIFDNICFDNIYIDGTNVNLIFTNCSFNERFKVLGANYIELENNKYTFYAFTNNCIDLIGDEILIKNDDFINSSFAKKFDEPFVDINFVGNKIYISNSNICTEYGGKINIMAPDLLLRESIINSSYIYLNADNITTKDGAVEAICKLKIDNKNCNFSCNVKSPVTIYNDLLLGKIDNQILDMNIEKIELLNARFRLINSLRTIKDNCIKLNQEKAMEIEKELNNRTISKVLRKMN